MTEHAEHNDIVKPSPFTDEVNRLMQSCIDHARDLLEAATVVQNAAKPNIAYHLAALSLEELGRRELIGLQTMANATTAVPPSWPLRHTQNHEQKMFWAFFGALFRGEKITKESVEQIRSFAKHIHTRRIAGLYVDVSDGLSVPSEVISAEETKNLIDLVTARLGMASLEEHRTMATDEEIDLQNWFLEATADENKNRFVFSDVSMTKLAEFGEARQWVEWIKAELESAQAQADEILRSELSKTSGSAATKPKWSVRIRLFADGHSVRPKALNWWNERVAWIRLVAVPERKNELIVELLFKEDVSLDRLWLAGWQVSRVFVAALNLATRGLWWWHLPRQTSRYYERVADLENALEVNMDRSPRLKIDWGKGHVLGEEALRQAMIRLTVLLQIMGTEARAAVDYYIGGLTFLGLNEIHWQCETQAYGNFHECLKLLMKLYGGWDGGEPFEGAFSRVLEAAAPKMPGEQADHFRAIAAAYEANTPEAVSVNLTDVAFIKILSDHYFASSVAPLVLKDAQVESESDE